MTWLWLSPSRYYWDWHAITSVKCHWARLGRHRVWILSRTLALSTRWGEYTREVYYQTDSNPFCCTGKYLLHEYSCHIVITVMHWRHLPEMNSITIITGGRWAAIPMKRTILGWSYCFRIRPSCKNFLLTSSCSVSRHVFTATSSFVILYVPLNTSPNWPCQKQVDRSIHFDTSPSWFCSTQVNICVH